MKLNLFSASDFQNVTFYPINGETVDENNILIGVANLCNRLLNERLVEKGVRVYNWNPSNIWDTVKLPDDKPTHQALLIAIEPIEKACVHRGSPSRDENEVWYCSRCGKKLKANWQVCE